MRVIEETPGYWRAVFDYPPFNVVDGDVFQALQDLLVRMETTESLRVVVFESALPDFYLSHFDLTGRLGNVMSAIGPTGLPILMDTFVRLTKAPVVSLARIRGCVRGVSSEFVLACDMRFASRENTKLGHPELGVGLHPGRRRHRAPSAPGGARAGARNRSECQRLRWRHSGTIRLCEPITSGRRAGRLRRCPRTPDRLLRSARSRCGKASRQRSLFAAVRSAPRRLHFVWNSTRVARSSEPYKKRAGTRTATRRRLREKLARGTRHARREWQERWSG